MKSGEVQAYRNKKGSGKSKGASRDGYYVEAYMMENDDNETGEWVMTPWPRLGTNNIHTVFEAVPLGEPPTTTT